MTLSHRITFYSLLVALLIVAACEPLAPYQYQPTAVSVIVTGEPTQTPVPSPTLTPTLTPTLAPTSTAAPTITPTPFPCASESGSFIDINDNVSDIADENLRFRVFVPPCYFQLEKRYPVLILLHGLSYREQQWEDLGIAQALEQGIRLGVLPPMIIVMPYMGNMGALNRFPPEPSYENVILDELLPQIESNFCTISNREHRAIGGISRGGFWAYSIALRHPDIFGIVGGHSAYFPSDTNEIPASNNPLELALNASFVRDADLRMYLDNGASDSSGPSQQLFSSRLTERDISHTYVVHPTGEHNNDYWASHVDEYLTFYGRNWNTNYGTLPSCSEPSP